MLSVFVLLYLLGCHKCCGVHRFHTVSSILTSSRGLFSLIFNASFMAFPQSVLGCSDNVEISSVK